MIRKLGWVFLVVIMFILFSAVNVMAADKDNESLTIKGDGITTPQTFTRTELEAMSANITQNIYSVTNNFPTSKLLYRRGVSLNYLLEQVGIKKDAKQIKFVSSDGYTRCFTRQELLDDDHYYFGYDGSRVQVPTIIAFSDSNKGFDTMRATEMVLTMGQRVKSEQNNPWLVKYLQTIEVSTAVPTAWPPVTFIVRTSANSKLVELKHDDFDMVKIYYTTDGSNPTINSTLYNVSTSYFQPELNRAITASDGMEIRAIAVGTGKCDSTVASYLISDMSVSFKDLDNYSWAEPAINNLSQRGIISGVGDSRFAPDASLTRAQFAKMMVLALEEKVNSTTASRFSDIKNTDWYCGYVEKAAGMGLINGYPDGSFHPDQVLNCEEMLCIAIKALGVKAENGESTTQMLPLINENRISDWARAYVKQAVKLELVEHGHLAVETDKGIFINGQGPTTRAEAAVTVYRMLNKL